MKWGESQALWSPRVWCALKRGGRIDGTEAKVAMILILGVYVLTVVVFSGWVCHSNQKSRGVASCMHKPATRVQKSAEMVLGRRTVMLAVAEQDGMADSGTWWSWRAC
jgi:hypothetical protein